LSIRKEPGMKLKTITVVYSPSDAQECRDALRRLGVVENEEEVPFRRHQCGERVRYIDAGNGESILEEEGGLEHDCPLWTQTGEDDGVEPEFN
jgi:hypothetical protein